jgi:hypothetical protein
LKRSTITSRKANVHSLKECIDELLDMYRIRGKFNQTQVIASWEKLMGTPVSRRTTDIFFRDNTLFVRLSSAALKHELSMSKSKIITLLNEDAGAKIVEEVVFL